MGRGDTDVAELESDWVFRWILPYTGQMELHAGKPATIVGIEWARGETVTL